MRLLFSLLLLQLSSFLSGQAPMKTTDIYIQTFSKEKIIGKPFPKFVALNEGNKINNDSLLGKVVLINFWFESCQPCLAEFGALNEVAQKLKENKDFEFISFTWNNAETIKRVKEKYKLQFKVLEVDDDECRRLNQNGAYPTNIILDRQGVIKYFEMGGNNDPVHAREYVMTTLLPKIEQEF